MIDRTRHGLNRRHAMLAMAGAGVAAPVLAWAQITAPITPPAITIPPVTPPRPPTPLVTAIDKTKIYYVFFDQSIDLNSMRSLRRQLAALVEAGVTQIVLVINSGGGLTLPALTTYSFIRSLPAKIDTHAQAFVASAATMLFLAGAERSADRAARFLFHPTQATVPGLLTEQQIRDQLMQVSTVEAAMDQVYLDRTKLTAEQVRSFSREQIVYTADEALQNGIIQTIADLKIPGDQTAKIIQME